MQGAHLDYGKKFQRRGRPHINKFFLHWGSSFVLTLLSQILGLSNCIVTYSVSLPFVTFYSYNTHCFHYENVGMDYENVN